MGRFSRSVRLLYVPLLLAAYDLWSMRKLHCATWVGSALVIGVGFLRFPFARTTIWQAFAAWVQWHTGYFV